MRLLDFGMAKFLEGSSSRTVPENLTRAGVVFGTPAYMSPEQVKAGPVDARSDVYAAGILLFELLAGRRPFVADTYEGYMGAHLTQPVPSLAKVRPKLPAARLFQPVDRAGDGQEAGGAIRGRGGDAGGAGGGRGQAAGRGRDRPRRRRARQADARRARRIAVGLAFRAPRDHRGHARGGNRGRGGVPAARAGDADRDRRAARRAAAQARAVRRQPPPPARPTVPPSPKPAPSEAADGGARAERQRTTKRRRREPEPPKNERQARARARNPWRAPVPRALKSIRDRLNHGAHLTQRALAPVYEFAHENPGDPRPWLLLGHAYAELDWYSDSVDRYVRADDVDSTCRGDPQMLTDLLAAAAHPTASRSAARAIRDIYGAEAIPALDKAKAMKTSAGRSRGHRAPRPPARIASALSGESSHP